MGYRACYCEVEPFCAPYATDECFSVVQIKGITTIKDSNFLRANNARLVWHPMTSPRDSIDNPPVIITESSGASITDIDGHTVVDAMGGLWNVNLGYSCQPVKDAIARQLDILPYYSIFQGTTNDAAIELSYELSQFFEPDGMASAFFTSGGSDSVETALRLARQYHKLRGEPKRTKFLSLTKGYHGSHMGGASVNGNAAFRNAYEPVLPGCFHIPAPCAYHNSFRTSDSERVAKLCVAALENEIAIQGAETIAAMIMEPILGAGGVIVPHESFAPMVSEVCKKHGILLISDEVITAYGRTGAWSGARLWGIQPDMMCTAKAITNGYYPFGALMLGHAMVETFGNNPGAIIAHGYTYSGHPVGAAAALACLAETRRLNVVDNAAKQGSLLYQGCLALMSKYDVIGDVRGGHGLMIGIELVRDRVTKESLDPASIAIIRENTYRAGAMVRAAGSSLIISPPLILSDADAYTILQALDSGFKALS